MEMIEQGIAFPFGIQRLRSCDFCRQRHLKCDGESTCFQCKKRIIPCRYSTRKISGPKLSRKQKLEQRISILKSELQRLKRQEQEYRMKIENLMKKKNMEKMIILNDVRLYLSSALYHFIHSHLRTRSPMIPISVCVSSKDDSFCYSLKRRFLNSLLNYIN